MPLPLGAIRSYWRRSFQFVRSLRFWLLAVGITALVTIQTPPGVTQQSGQVNHELVQSLNQQTPPLESVLPPPKIHPLPQSLAKWKDVNQSGDYFDQIKQTIVGYLIWTHFPVTVYIQPVSSVDATNPFSLQRSQNWVNAISQAVQEWSQYLSLEIVTQPEGADISVLRSPPPIRLEQGSQQANNPNSSEAVQKRTTLALGRVRSAETRFELYAKKAQTEPATLAHRFTILLRPDQTPEYLQAAARHEFGHALGIWGHSSRPTDALYFSQVRHPPAISSRDLNTLKKIYEHPTRLGWELPQSALPE